MEGFSEKAVARQLRHFDAVWARVDSGRSARALAERAGAPLMPRKQGCCRTPRPCRGR